MRDVLAVHFEEKAKVLFGNPWMIRDDYINIILDRSLHNVESFFTKHEIKPLTDEERMVLTDAAKIFTLNQEKVYLVDGDVTNIKITYPYDLKVANTILQGNR